MRHTVDKWYKCVWDTLFVSSGLVTPESQKVLDDWKTWVRITVSVMTVKETRMQA